MKTLVKAPGEVLDYAVTWDDLAPGDAIKTSTWIVPKGLTLVKDGLSGGVATVWLSGGKMNNRFTVINRVVTTAGRTQEKHFRLVIGLK